VDSQLPRGQTILPKMVQVHFDGACQPPRGGGIAAYGFTVEGAGLDHEGRGLAVRPWSPQATNNVAEYTAAIRALEWLVGQGYTGSVLVLGDSELVIKQMNGEYEVRAEHLKAYHARLGQLSAKFGEVKFVWIPREDNQRADELSKLAIEDAAPDARRVRRQARAPEGDAVREAQKSA
jgi:ribonuclease HI